MSSLSQVSGGGCLPHRGQLRTTLAGPGSLTLLQLRSPQDRLLTPSSQWSNELRSQGVKAQDTSFWPAWTHPPAHPPHLPGLTQIRAGIPLSKAGVPSHFSSGLGGRETGSTSAQVRPREGYGLTRLAQGRVQSWNPVGLIGGPMAMSLRPLGGGPEIR